MDRFGDDSSEGEADLHTLEKGSVMTRRVPLGPTEHFTNPSVESFFNRNGDDDGDEYEDEGNDSSAANSSIIHP